MVCTVLSPVLPVIDRLPTEMLVSDRSKVTLSLPVPRLTERFPVTSSRVTGPAWPLMVVPSPGVIWIRLAAGWLIVRLLAPLSVMVRLPSTRLVETLAGVSRSSSDSRPGRKRTGLRTGACLRRRLRLINLPRKLRSNICNLLMEEGTRSPGQTHRGSEAPAASPAREQDGVFPSAARRRASLFGSVADGRPARTPDARAGAPSLD